jgi:hypothetical protein
MMSPQTWLQGLYSLLARFPEYGIGADITALSLAELWGVYRFLARLAEGG